MKFESFGKQSEKKTSKDFDPSRRAFLKRSAEVGAAVGAAAFAPKAVAEILLKDEHDATTQATESALESHEALARFAAEFNTLTENMQPDSKPGLYTSLYRYIAENEDLYEQLPYRVKLRIAATYRAARDHGFGIDGDSTFEEADAKLMHTMIDHGYLFFSEGPEYFRDGEMLPRFILDAETKEKELAEYPWMEELFEGLDSKTKIQLCYTHFSGNDLLYGTVFPHFPYAIINRGGIEATSFGEEYERELIDTESNEAAHLLLFQKYDFQLFDEAGNLKRDFPEAINLEIHELISDAASILMSTEAARSFISTKINQARFGFEKESGRTRSKAQWFVGSYHLTIDFLIDAIHKIAKEKEDATLEGYLAELAGITHQVDTIEEHDIYSGEINPTLQQAALDKIQDLHERQTEYAPKILALLNDSDISQIQHQYKEKALVYTRKIRAQYEEQHPAYQAGKK